MKYSDIFVENLLKIGFNTVFYVPGGNIMHLLESCRTRLRCIPVIHEVSSVIAAEYFNETSDHKALALVTAGPGLTNAVTGIAGAWLESRELLIVGGQVKSTDLKRDSGVRQNGIQELDGVALVGSICKSALRIDHAYPISQLMGIIQDSRLERPGPLFLEFCLDVQGSEVSELLNPETRNLTSPPKKIDLDSSLFKVRELLKKAARPIFLMGGGISRDLAPKYVSLLEHFNMPIMTTWNGADRIPYDHPLYSGRPNTWGQRSANIILQQSDLLIAVGTRLGVQQIGFNWEAFLPLGTVIHVDIDATELNKNTLQSSTKLNISSYTFLNILEEALHGAPRDFSEWLEFIQIVKKECPNVDPANSSHEGYWNPFKFIEELSNIVEMDAIIVPCSSGGAFTTTMQSFKQKRKQKIVTNKGLASMGYGLAGAIGSSIGNSQKQVILIEGDGGFSQNLQEIGTLVQTQARVKLFLYVNDGYASIRMNQKNYFGGNYMGCDTKTGLGIPNWELLFKAYGLETKVLSPSEGFGPKVLEELRSQKPSVFLVPIHPEQTYWPKVSSRVLEDGTMESNPIHLMYPPLDQEVAKKVFRYL
jgi:acetolactate synthase-1/2/3 large subunit